MTTHRTPPAADDDLRDRFESVAPVILVDPEPVVRRGRRRRAVVRAAGGLGVVAAVLAVAMLVRPGGGVTGPAVTTPPPVETSSPVSLSVAPSLVAPGDVVTVVLVASEANDLTFGIAADIERWDGDEWRRAGVTALCLAEWSCVGEVTDRLDAVEDIGLGAQPGEPGSTTLLSTEGLGEGWYRIVQEAVLDRGVATGVFEVRADAVAAPPLPDPDGVRLTVTPALVPTEGGVVRVVTEVPAGPDGTLTAEDIEAVDSVLDPAVLVQRWDGETWSDVVEVLVGGREAGLGVEWGTAVLLPSLDEGSYRMVREWIGNEAPWGVFTVAEGAPPLTGAVPAAVDDFWAPGGEACENDPGLCLLQAWWGDVVAEAGLERAGGDHDLGPALSDSVRLEQGVVGIGVIPARDFQDDAGFFTITSTTQVGDVRVDTGSGSGVPDLRKLTCGALIVHASPVDADAAEVDRVVTAIATAMQGCPADLDELAARYPDVPPLPSDG